MEYKIVDGNWFESTASALESLESRVRVLIAAGWIPLGGVVVDATEDGQCFYQVMTRTKTKG